MNFSALSHGNLGNNAAHQFAMQRALRIYHSNTIYSFIPKNACSTMRLSLAIENGCIDNTEADHGWFHQNNDTFSADLASLITARYTFVILRCPYARLASVYLDKVVGKEPAGAMFANIMGIRSGSEGVSFDTFVRAMKNPVVRDANPHWRPQRDFLVYKQYDDYFCLEEFDKAIPQILEKAGLQIYDARRVTGHGLDKLELIEHGNHGNLCAAEILSMKLKGKCPSPRSLYNDELVAITGEVFSEDIAIYARHFDRKNMLFGLLPAS